MKDRVTIKIPRELYDKLQDIIKDTGFSSVNEYIVFTMRMMASSEISNEEKNVEELNFVKERLKKLGYL